MLPGPFRRLRSRHGTSRAGDRDAVGPACVEPLEGRRLLSAGGEAPVYQYNGVTTYALFYAEQTAAEWGFQPLSGDPAEIVTVVAAVGHDKYSVGAVDQQPPTETYASVWIDAVSSEGVYFSFNSDPASFEGDYFDFTAEQGTSTLDAVIPLVDVYTGAAATASVHMVWEIESRPATEGSVVYAGEYLETTHWRTRSATASGTVTLDAYGPINLTPGTSSDAVVGWLKFQYVLRTGLTPARDLFSQTPVLN